MATKKKSKKSDNNIPLLAGLAGLGILGYFMFKPKATQAATQTIPNTTTTTTASTTPKTTSTSIAPTTSTSSTYATSPNVNNLSLQTAISVLVSAAPATRTISQFVGMEPVYLIAWANGVLNRQMTFRYNSRNFYSATGKFAL